MDYVELRIRVKDTRTILAWRQNAPPVDGAVHYEALARQTIRVLTRWVAEDRVSRRDELAVLGSHLYRILFANAVEKELQEAQAHQKRTNATLRLVLEFMPEARELATLPWEYLYVPDDDKSGTGFFVAAENRLILSRHVP